MIQYIFVFELYQSFFKIQQRFNMSFTIHYRGY